MPNIPTQTSHPKVAVRKALRLPIGANYHGHKADEELSGWQVAKTLVDGRLGLTKDVGWKCVLPPFAENKPSCALKKGLTKGLYKSLMGRGRGLWGTLAGNLFWG